MGSGHILPYNTDTFRNYNIMENTEKLQKTFWGTFDTNDGCVKFKLLQQGLTMAQSVPSGGNQPMEVETNIFLQLNKIKLFVYTTC